VGGEQPGAEEGQECHSFEVRAERWPGGQVLTCAFVSDIDNLERRFDVGGDWTASGIRTAVTDPAVMGKWVGSILSCTPGQ
ncbi:hypothetical protein, partial [Tsukamurella conjunctivitidis]|uniref:hypothetical protein n=1 Tax=Tsukamurella conjunctivitidis TaxID=2592068 RepID=UPI00195FEFB6